jgi:hypothetical protein
MDTFHDKTSEIISFESLHRYYGQKRLEKNAIPSAEKNRQQCLADIETGVWAEKFVAWLENCALTERNRKVSLRKWHKQYARVIADYRIPETVTGGAAQIGKSLFHYLLCIYTAEQGAFNTLYLFAKASIRDKLVGSTIQPLTEYNLPHFNNKWKLKNDNTRARVTEAATSYYSFLNNPSLSDNVSVPVEIASISVDVRFIDEISQVPAKLVSASGNRQDYAQIPSKPVRKLGTPGKAGIGLDTHLALCDYEFYLYCQCTHCHQLASLHPEKALLKEGQTQDSEGNLTTSFYDQEFRPVDWFWKDAADKVKTAYIGCEHCGAELEDEIRFNASYYDMHTLYPLESLLQDVADDPYVLRRIGIHTPPLVRETKYNLAASLISEGLTTDDTENWVQQSLGLSTTSEHTGLNPRILRESINSRLPFDLYTYEKVRMLGLDQARGSHYVCVSDMHIPKKGDSLARYRRTYRKVLGFYRVPLSTLTQFVERTAPIVGCLDAAPELTVASQIFDQYGFFPVLQKNTDRIIFQEDEATTMGGVDVKTFSCNNQYFISQTLKNFFYQDECGNRMTQLPSSLEYQIGTGKLSYPLNHLLGIQFNPDKEKFEKSGGSRCDYFYALMFAEIALYHYIFHNVDVSGYLSWFR